MHGPDAGAAGLEAVRRQAEALASLFSAAPRMALTLSGECFAGWTEPNDQEDWINAGFDAKVQYMPGRRGRSADKRKTDGIDRQGWACGVYQQNGIIRPIL